MMNAFFQGVIAMGSFVVALFFLRFWRQTNDRFFLFFAASFGVEALNRAMLGAIIGANEASPSFYLIRLGAYALIIAGILDKNRR